jgi:S-adenosylmethionine synthetase
MSEGPELVIIYHPGCKASQKLLSKIPDDFKIIKTVDIRTIKNIPPHIKSVPVGIQKEETITGKELFNKVENMINGPISANIFGASNMAGFINGSSNFSLNSNYSCLGNGNDGFSGVPKYDDSQARTLDSLKSERN